MTRPKCYTCDKSNELNTLKCGVHMCSTCIRIYNIKLPLTLTSQTMPKITPLMPDEYTFDLDMP